MFMSWASFNLSTKRLNYLTLHYNSVHVATGIHKQCAEPEGIADDKADQTISYWTQMGSLTISPIVNFVLQLVVHNLTWRDPTVPRRRLAGQLRVSIWQVTSP